MPWGKWVMVGFYINLGYTTIIWANDCYQYKLQCSLNDCTFALLTIKIILALKQKQFILEKLFYFVLILKCSPEMPDSFKSHESFLLIKQKYLKLHDPQQPQTPDTLNLIFSWDWLFRLQIESAYVLTFEGTLEYVEGIMEFWMQAINNI